MRREIEVRREVEGRSEEGSKRGGAKKEEV